ncbi:hypothetical protein CGJ39_24470 [Vibrio parahaemolyticus]|uniref:hypothetical protein n=1 Tax=Vibrio parahaemolyticus TaxID=670 RepID=UPI00111FEF17|nr:hypothetical protein [Vibrio parahaemolyticus]TOE57353.1 hypothetical protein CGJ39_24470 [Vibrio parahaemolyticus]HCE3689775.1 hypothetical protein [Vibrio parahaemolyticus]
MSTKKRNSLISISASSEMKELWSDISEMSLDKVLESVAKDQEFLRDIPIIKWISTSISIKNSIQSAAFIKKYSNFIGQIHLGSFSEADIVLLGDAVDVPAVTDEIVENTMIYLDRYHNELKAKLLGKLFVETFKSNRFSVREYNYLLFSIEQIHPFEGLDTLKKFYDYKLRMDGASTDEEKRKIWGDGAKIDFQPLAMSGLLRLPSGGSNVGDLGGAYINEIGVKFYEFVVRDIVA